MDQGDFGWKGRQFILKPWLFTGGVIKLKPWVITINKTNKKYIFVMLGVFIYRVFIFVNIFTLYNFGLYKQGTLH